MNTYTNLNLEGNKSACQIFLYGFKYIFLTKTNNINLFELREYIDTI